MRFRSALALLALLVCPMALTGCRYGLFGRPLYYEPAPQCQPCQPCQSYQPVTQYQPVQSQPVNCCPQ